MVDAAQIVQIGGLVGSFCAAAFYGAKKITNEAQKTRATVAQTAGASGELITNRLDRLNEVWYRELELRQAESFNSFQKLHAVRYAELNEVLSSALRSQLDREVVLRDEISSLKASQADLTAYAEKLTEALDNLADRLENRRT